MTQKKKLSGRKCSVSNKKPMFGHNVSHAQNKTKRKFNVGLQSRNLFFVVDGATKAIRVRISQHAYRTIDKIRNTQGDLQAMNFLLASGAV